MGRIDAAPWRACRPKARRVRALSRVCAVLLVVGTFTGLMLADHRDAGLLAAPVVGYAGGRCARFAWSWFAIRPIRGATRGTALRSTQLAALVAYGAVVVRDVCWVAVEDADSVVLTTRRPGPRGPELSITAIVNLQGGGGA